MKAQSFKRKPTRRVAGEHKQKMGTKSKKQNVREREVFRPGEDLPAWRSLVRFAVLGMLIIGSIYLSVVTMNILVLGTDDVDYSKHTDTIMLVHWRPLPRRLALLSVPRDTLITLPKRGPMKINAVYAYGNAIGSRDYALAMTRATIENLLGLKVHYTVHIKYSSFIKLVDAIGGVPMYVSKRMKYTDHAGGVNIDLEPGYQLLDGRQSLNYVRFRHDRDGDIGRIRRQQAFVKAFVTQLARFSRLPKTTAAFFTFLKEVETNLTVPAALFLALEVKSIAKGSWRQAILPGKGVYIKGISYWKTDPEDVRKVVAALGRPPRVRSKKKVEPVSADTKPVAQATQKKPVRVAPRPTAVPTKVPVRQPRKVALPAGRQPIIRVLNGCGVGGVASKIAAKVRSINVTIKEADITNAPSFDYTYTIIKSNPKNLPWARRIATILGLDEDRIQQIPKSVSYPSVTVVIGKDYNTILNR